MNRSDFLSQTGLLAAMGFIPENILAASSSSKPNTLLQPVVVPAQKALEHNGGMAIRTHIRSSMTNGLYSNVECAVAPKLMGPPPHYHKELDELMYVLEGEASILVGKDVVKIQAGGWHLRPRMLTHTFWNASDKDLRFIDMYFNQPFEEYLERIFHELTVENGYQDGTDKKFQEINKLNEKFGVIFESGAFEQQNEIKKQYNLK
jgi:mannose-6-phosphate isomerase-like protein (cupin superfamily)